MRRLVVNADDFGRSEAINAGVRRAHVEGIVTSASLMVCHPATPEAVRIAREHPELGVGLHLELGQLERSPALEAARREIARQLETFRRLARRDPTHVDSHHHAHEMEPLRSAAIEIAQSLGIPLRGHSRVRYCGAFYGRRADGTPDPDAITAQALARLIRALPEGATEIGCHPAAAAEPFTSYSYERPLELAALCDPAVRLAVSEARVELCSFTDLSREPYGPR